MSRRSAEPRLPTARLPALAARLLRWSAGPASADYLLAELGEEVAHRRARGRPTFGRIWFRLQAWRLACRFTAHRLRNGRRDSPGDRASMLDTLMQDLRYAARTLTRSPSATLVALLALAVGIGANTAIFSVVHGVLQSLPYAGGDRIVLAYEGDGQTRERRMPLSAPDVIGIEDLEGDVFDTVTAYSYTNVVLEGDPNPERFQTARISHDFMDMLGSAAFLGREFSAAEGADSHVVVLGYELWRQRFGGDPDILERNITISGVPHRVIGVTRPDFTYFNDTNRPFLLLAFTPDQRSDAAAHTIYPLARLRAGFDLATADERIAAAVARRQEAVGHRTDRPRDVWLFPLYDAWVGSVQRRLLIVMGAVGLLALVACSNVAGLQMARGLRRSKEIATRLALGARPGRVARQLITESALLATIGGAVGLLVAWATVGWLRSTVQTQLPRTDNIEVDFTVLAFTMGLSAVVGVLSGLAPAWLATRSELIRPLAEGAATIAGGHGGRLRSALVVAQVALAVILAVGAGLLVRSFNEARGRDLGYRPEQVVVADLSISGRDTYADPQRARLFFEEVMRRAGALAGVTSIGGTSMPPGFAAMMASETSGEDSQAPPVAAATSVITPGLVATLGIELLQGRDVGSVDTAEGAPVALVNEALAEQLWPEKNAIGQRLRLSTPRGEGPWRSVVGIVANTRQTPLSEPDRPHVYVPLAQRSARYMGLVVRLDGAESTFTASFRRVLAEIDAEQPFSRVRSLSSTLQGVLAADRVNSVLLSLFALLALGLAAVGEYAVIQQIVAQRTGEIGVRMAMGADTGSVLTLVVRQGLGLATAGLIVGLAGAWLGSGVLASMLHGVEPTDRGTYLLVAVLLLAVAAISSIVPARRAARIDPVSALRQE